MESAAGFAASSAPGRPGTSGANTLPRPNSRGCLSPPSGALGQRCFADQRGSSSLHLLPGQILAPSASAANNAARLRNGGRRMRPAVSASESSLKSVHQASASSSCPNLVVGLDQTPRTLRGDVRKFSEVEMGQHEGPPYGRKSLPAQPSYAKDGKGSSLSWRVRMGSTSPRQLRAGELSIDMSLAISTATMHPRYLTQPWRDPDSPLLMQSSRQSQGSLRHPNWTACIRAVNTATGGIPGMSALKLAAAGAVVASSVELHEREANPQAVARALARSPGRSPRGRYMPPEWNRPYEPAAVAENCRNDSELRAAGRQKSRQLMGALYELRRATAQEDPISPVSPGAASAPAAVSPGDAAADAGTGAGAADAAAALPASAANASPKPSPRGEQDEPLLYATLRDTQDNEAVLRRSAAMLQEGHDAVDEYGGNRHATAVISARSLAVVKRKADLLQKAEARLKALEEGLARQEDVVKELLAGAMPADFDGSIGGVTWFAQSIIHKGDPAEANKSDFRAFVTSFGLPEKHSTLLKMQEIGAQATEWFAKAALKAAEAGTDTLAVHRIMQMAERILGNEKHPAIVKCRTVLGNVLAENCNKSAKQIKEKDQRRVESTEKAQPESAKQCAQDVNFELTQAVNMGASMKHPHMLEAKEIYTYFLKEEKDRLALKVLQYAQHQQQKDQATAAKSPGIPPVGPASGYADDIEKEAEAVVKQGVKQTHETLQEALGIAKALRAEDGERKRLLAREQRLAKQGAAK